MASDSPPVADARPRGWPLFLLGVVVFFAGPIAGFVQTAVLGLMPTPWLMPALSVAGVALMGLSLCRRFGIARTIGFVFFVLLTGLEFFFVLVLGKTPLYTGPAQPGSPLPAFETTLAADGSTLTNRNLTGDGGTVIHFYRGHW